MLARLELILNCIIIESAKTSASASNGIFRAGTLKPTSENSDAPKIAFNGLSNQ